MTTPWRRFHPTASLAYAFCDTDLCPVILTKSSYDPKAVQEFLRRWNVEIAAVSSEVLTPQFLAALSLAATDGNPVHGYYHGALQSHLAPKIPEPFLKGDTRELFSEFGLFGSVLALARNWTNNESLTKENLQTPKIAFEIVKIWADRAIVVFQSQCTRDPDPLELALLLHGSPMTYSNKNDFRIHYRNRLLNKFIGFYNSFFSIKKEPSHAETSTQ